MNKDSYNTCFKCTILRQTAQAIIKNFSLGLLSRKKDDDGMEMLWLDFLNTDYHDWKRTGRDEDRLLNPERLSRLLKRWELHAGVPPEQEELASLQQFRSSLRGMAEALVGGAGLGSADLELLNRHMSKGRMVHELSLVSGHDGEAPVYQLHEKGGETGWSQVLAEIAASFARMLAQHEPSRIRICDNPDCLWVFYDDTRSRTKRYCEDTMCGNVMKVRRFRAKQKQAERKEGHTTGPEDKPS
jgi:predicted RNA-binding Zn ribbon-like protein